MLEIAAGGFDFVARFEDETRRRRSPRSGRCSRSIDGSSTCAGAAKAAGSRWATPTSASRRRTRRCYPNPGEIIFYPGGVSETEILIAYGYVAFASKAGALAGNHFATIVEGNENLRAARAELPLGGRAADLIPRG